MGAYPPPRREPRGLRQTRRESVLSARREASDRLVRDQLDQQQLARAEQLSIISSAEEELADEKRTQRSMRCGVVLSVLEDVRAQWRQLISLKPQDISSLLITTSLIFAKSLPFKKLPKNLLNKILEEARWLRVVELLQPLLKASSCCNLYGTKLFQNFVLCNLKPKRMAFYTRIARHTCPGTCSRCAWICAQLTSRDPTVCGPLHPRRGHEHTHVTYSASAQG